MNDTKSPRTSSCAIARWLTVAIAVLSAALALYGTYAIYQQHTVEKKHEAERTRERHAVAEIEKLGGFISHAGTPPDHRVTRVSLVGTIEIVDGKTVITESPITDEDLRYLGVLTELQELQLKADGFTNAGLKHLQGLTTLKRLTINNPGITDEGLEFLQGLTSLKTLNLTGTSVTEKGIEDLQESLPDCTITFTK